MSSASATAGMEMNPLAQSETGTLAQAVPTRLDVPDEVLRKFGGVQLAWGDKKTGQQGVLTVPLGGTVKLPGSEIEIRADSYLPAFEMTADAITSRGTDETNPAARVTATDKGSQIFSGWLFQNSPDVHPFQHVRYTIRLAGGTPRKQA